MPKKPFKGMIKLDVRDSVADWEPYLPAKAPEGAPNILFVLYDDTGPGRVVALRRRHQHADAAEAGRPRPALFAVAHDGAVLADALDAPDRPQPSPERHGRDHRGRQRIPRRERTHPARVRDDARRFCRTTAGAPSGSARTTTCRSRTSPPARRASSGRCNRASTASTASSAARPTSGIRTSSTTTSSSTSRTARKRAITSRRIWPTRRSACSATITPRNPSRPWYMWFCPGANHAPHHCPQDYIDKYKGKFDDGLRGLPRVGAAADDREGHPAEGHRADAAQPAARRRGERRRHGASLGLAQRRREEAVLAPDGGVRGLLRVHRRAGRPDHRLSGADRPARQHRRHLRGRQRRVGRGQPERIGEREQVLQRLSRTSSRRT